MRKNKDNQEEITKIDFKTRIRWKFLKLKYKLRKIEINKEKLTIRFFIGLAFFSIAIGLLVFVVFLFKLSKEYTISNGQLLLDKSAEVGDFIGGIVGAIWALTGVLLFYATLRLQSRELAENRKHFQISRLTEIIYKQLDLFNNQLSTFELRDLNKDNDGDYLVYKGRAAFFILRQRIESITDIEKGKKNEEERNTEIYKYLAKNFAFIEVNQFELQKIYNELDNHVDVIRAVLIKEGIPPSDLNELKSIFFRNVGLDLIKSSEFLKNSVEWFIRFKEKQGKEFNTLFSPLHSIIRHIAVIEEFRNKSYNEKLIKDYLKERDFYNYT